VPARTIKGPIALGSYLSRLSIEQRDAWNAVIQAHKGTPETVLDLALFWTDGKRSLADIAQLVELETGVVDVEYMVHYVKLLQELGLIDVLGERNRTAEGQSGD